MGAARVHGRYADRRPSTGWVPETPVQLRRPEEPPAPVVEDPPGAGPGRGAELLEALRAQLGGAQLRRTHVVVLVLVAVLGLTVAGCSVLASAPRPVPVQEASTAPVGAPTPEPGPGAATTGPPAPAATPSPGGQDEAPEPTVMLVHVAGEVAEPGVVELPVGARVSDALHAAGGLEPGVETGDLNLAQVLADGQQVRVEAETGAGGEGGGTVTGGEGPGDLGADGEGGDGSEGGAGGGVPAGPVDLNTADLDTLDTLPGIGPALAERIVQWRETNGSFSDVGELLEVSGIGEAKLADLQDLVTW